MSAIRYLLDENVDPVLAGEMLKREPDMVVWRVGIPGAPRKGTLDPDILAWCEAHSFVLVTNNRQSMPSHLRDHLAAGRHVPGILVLNPHTRLGDVLEDLRLIWLLADPAEYQDQIAFLPI
jgi:hypothetical protein